MGFTMTSSYVAFAVLHFILFVLALAVIGLYGTDVDRARKHGVDADGKWVFALVVASLSALTTAIYLIPSIFRSVVVPIWSFIIFVLWIAVFGLFGSMYIHEDPEGNIDIQRMKNAVWVDLANALLWLIATGAALGYWIYHRNRNTRFTGRAQL
ncbi:hypothetical protein F5B22DRAFT_625093 [Xylaria bambusicola]|uniref:uncharacterized protein n=1 Tax=Xylaria bambusicola TaxID=326684 RepID=UPI0020081FDE|nr:uncharacterized protein F5B22DRAFT_625093 [Xylaria bambusicola]KAI0506189.1 hypothetical protein F5B22DRAFT_625093 [Xylaria bambusicola]